MRMGVWDDIADDAAEAENLKLRAALIRAIRLLTVAGNDDHGVVCRR